MKFIHIHEARGDPPSSPSPLAGIPASRSLQTQFNLVALTRREWWLWCSTATVTLLSAGVFLLTAFPRLFQHRQHFYELGLEQSRWSVLCLLLLFNAWMVYRQRRFRRLRKGISKHNLNSEKLASFSELAGFDLATGLLNHAAAEQQLGKEIGRAKRQNTSLSLATLHIEDAVRLAERYGHAAFDQALKEFARRLKEASRGSDYVVRLAADDFVLVLPKCNLGEVSRVLDRIGTVEVAVAGKRLSLTYTTGWVDYQPGDLPSDVLKRAMNLLHLYNSAADRAYCSSVATD
jgi:diguanylate cyclase (GGDEF)-like protein